jgi:hypothetical protein
MHRRPSDVGNDGSIFYEKVYQGFFFFQRLNFWEKEFCLGIRIGNINPLIMSTTGIIMDIPTRMDFLCVEKIYSPNQLALNEMVYLASFLNSSIFPKQFNISDRRKRLIC